MESSPPESKTTARGASGPELSIVMGFRYTAPPPLTILASRHSASARAHAPGFGGERKWQAAGNALRFQLHKAGILKMDAGATVSVPGACVMDGHVLCRIFDSEAATGFLLVSDLNKLAATVDAKPGAATCWITVTHFPVAGFQTIQHQRLSPLSLARGTDKDCEQRDPGKDAAGGNADGPIARSGHMRFRCLSPTIICRGREHYIAIRALR
jgi:hypothetical protein